jgi:calcineurin-like phosphoesterase family protein
MTTYFTADTHFGHDSIRKHCGRPFKTVAEMDKTLIANWNARVRPRDTVYHLGDFAFKASRQIEDYRRKLNGKIHLIRGNHDSKDPGRLERVFDSVHSLHCIRIEGQTIVLCHYAMRVWEKEHHGSWHLYAHSHGRLPDNRLTLSFDVGVDSHNYMPISFEEVREEMVKRQEDMAETGRKKRDGR